MRTRAAGLVLIALRRISSLAPTRASVPQLARPRASIVARSLAGGPLSDERALAAQIDAQSAMIRGLKDVQGLGNKSPEVKEAVAELLRLKALAEPAEPEADEIEDAEKAEKDVDDDEPAPESGSAGRANKSNKRPQSDYAGVVQQRDGEWQATWYTIDNKVPGVPNYVIEHFGDFDNEEDAARAHDARARKEGRTAVLNFPEPGEGESWLSTRYVPPPKEPKEPKKPKKAD